MTLKFLNLPSSSTRLSHVKIFTCLTLLLANQGTRRKGEAILKGLKRERLTT